MLQSIPGNFKWISAGPGGWPGVWNSAGAGPRSITDYNPIRTLSMLPQIKLSKLYYNSDTFSLLQRNIWRAPDYIQFVIVLQVVDLFIIISDSDT